MTKQAQLFILTFTLIAACSPPAVEEPMLPSPTADADPALRTIEASPDFDGRVVGRSEARATIVVLFTSWCGNCRVELDVIAALRPAHPRTRVLGLNYKGHEEYDQRGNADAVRAYVERSAPWLRVVPADEALFTALGRPPKVPTIFVYDERGVLVTRYDRRIRSMPDGDELDALLRRLGA